MEECIRNGFDVVNYTEQGNGLIHLASYKGQLRVLQRLILQGIWFDSYFYVGCNIHQKGREGNTSLHYACYNNNKDCIYYLISK